ncbi:MAG: TetR/AcrR family transcriptional regulator [Thermoleophilia bacterium]
MARTINAASHALRREAFIDVAEHLIQSMGYEEMSIQNVLDELGSSRGAFYHYFDSKAALLDAVIERMVETVIATLAPLVADPALPAVQKLQAVFTGIASGKSRRTDLMTALLRVWLADENAIVREKLRRGLVIHLAPLLATIVRQGVDERVFTSSSPDDTGRVLVSLIQGANDTATELFVARQDDRVSFADVERTLTTYFAAFEQILGLPSGSLTTIDATVLRQWYG